MTSENKIKKTNIFLKWGSPFLFSIVFLSILALGVVQYRLYCQFNRTTANLETRLKDYDQQLSHKIQHETKLIKAFLGKQITQNRRAFRQLSKNIKLYSPESVALWQLYEAQHLLRLASFHSEFYDIKTAKALLAEADKLLQGLQMPSLNRVRLAVKQDEVALNGVESLDLEGVWYTLETLIQQVPSLTLQGAFSGASFEAANKQVQPTQVPLPKGSESWQENLKRTAQELKSLIKIRRHTTPLAPLLTSKEQQLLKTELVSLLEQIRAALLQRHSQIYHASVLRTKGFILTYFRSDDAKAQGMIRTLEQLSSLNVRPKMPAISDSLVTLEKVIFETQMGADS